MNNDFKLVIDTMISELEKKSYMGYDPYDALNMPLPWEKIGHRISMYLIQLLKRLPLNFRPLLVIKPGHNPKAMGLFLHAFCILFKKTRDAKYLKRADYFFDWLMKHTSEGFAGSSWGYNFLWVSPIRFLPAYTPSAVVTGFNCRAIYAYYKITSNKKAEELLLNAAEFVLKELPIYEDSSGISISYTPLKEEVCYNASLMAAETLAYAFTISKSADLKKKIVDAVSFVLSRQKNDGHWDYSEDPKKKSTRSQIDFHQGYIIDSLEIICKLLPELGDPINSGIIKGMKFYQENQFLDTGQAFYRLPKRYPTDIHHIAQGVLSFSRQSVNNPSSTSFAEKIARWGISNMYSSEGYFYYRKGKFFTNKLNYIRWGQAWMLLSLSEVL